MLGSRRIQQPTVVCSCPGGRRGVWWRAWPVAVLATLLLPGSASAHPGLRASPEDWWTAWNWDAVLLINLLLLTCFYARGLARLIRRRSATRRFLLPAAAGLLAILSLLVALVSPLDALSESLSSAHMVQHMVLMTVAAPLLALASPALVTFTGLPRGWQKGFAAWQRTRFWRSARQLTMSPVVVWSLHAAVLWVWHVPAFYLTALRSPLLHDLQHLSFFAAAFLFWRPMLDGLSPRRFDRGVSILMLFTTSLHATLLGAFMSFSPRAWYADYVATAPVWGMTALEDQQVAGFIMWIPACSVYAFAAAALFVKWIDQFSEADRPVGRALASGPRPTLASRKMEAAKSW